MTKLKMNSSQEIQIRIGEITFPGNLDLPENFSGIVLFAHGSGSSRFSVRNQKVAKFFQENGIATLLFDLLTPNEEAEDAYTAHLRFNIGMLSTRLQAATETIVNRFQNQSNRSLNIGYFGASTGGAAAIMAAAESQIPIKAVVSRGGRPDLSGSALTKIKTATLLIVGENDREVLEMNRQAFQKLQCEKSLVTIPNATHLFPEPGALEEVSRLAAEWFRNHFTDLIKSD